MCVKTLIDRVARKSFAYLKVKMFGCKFFTIRQLTVCVYSSSFVKQAIKTKSNIYFYFNNILKSAVSAVVGKDSVTIGADNITAGKAFGSDDTNGPITSKSPNTGAAV